jgi:LysM repeat protein
MTMLRKLYRAFPILVVCAVMVTVAVITPRATLAQAPGQNLLVDPGFESPFAIQDGIAEALVAQGWRAWWVDVAPSYVNRPSNCDDNARSDCYWMRPKFELVAVATFPDHVHSGGQAQQYSSFGRMHEGGLYQRVTGLTSGTTLRFSIFMQAWQCANLDDCGKGGSHSDQPFAMHLKVGIDPFGGTDPFSPNVVWSPERESFDQWTEFAVQAKAQGDAVTVFTHSRAEFDWARQLNNVYLDDASLAVSSGEAATPSTPVVAPTQTAEATAAPTQPAEATAAATQPAGTPAPTSPPAATKTPGGEGAVVHVVKAGDTLYGISLQYDVSVDDLLKLNNLTRDSILSIGQEIVVKAGAGGAAPVQPTPTLKATVAPTAQATTTAAAAPTAAPLQSPLPTPGLPPPSATPVRGGLCMSAFDDTNGNTVRDGNEPGLADVTFVILSGGSEVARYSTDSSGKPYCLTTLPPGAYSVQIMLPLGYVSALDNAEVALALGQQVDLTVAAHQGEKATPTVAPTVKAQATPAASPLSGTALIAVVLFGIAFLILIGAAVLIIRRGR